MAADWLANFSDYRVMIELWESYELIESDFKIRIQSFYDYLLIADLRQKYDEVVKILRLFYEVLYI